MPISLKKRAQVKEAIRKAAMAALDQHMPADWIKTPPEEMDAADRRVFDVITELEVVATRLVDATLA